MSAHFVIALAGHGVLADAVATAFSDNGNGLAVARFEAGGRTEFPDDVAVAVVANDAWDTAGYPGVREACADRGIPWLPVRAELGQVVIGPVEYPGATGCGTCAEARRRLARLGGSDYQAVWKNFDAVWKRNRRAMTSRRSSWLSGIAADLAAEYLLQEVRNITVDPASVLTKDAIVLLDLRTLRGSVHRFLPDPTCAVCGYLPADGPELAASALQTRKKPSPDNYRVRDIASEMAALEKVYVDAEVGLVPEMRHGSAGGLALAEAPLGLRGGGVEIGYGRAGNYRDSELVALMEVLERFGSDGPGSKRTSVRASYREVAEHAVDPRRLGTHPSESYERPGFPFQRFHESVRCNWVWGYSFARDEPVLVPESYVYYNLPYAGPESRPFVQESGNGCAVGGCLEEAIFYGILEIAERDAFLLTWYARISPPRIDLDSSSDETIPLLVSRIRAASGYDVMLFDISVEQRIPCVWAMAVHPDGAEPTMICAAASHPHPEKAAEHALNELAPLLAEFTDEFPPHRRQANLMVRDPFLVKEMEDHLLVNATIEAIDRRRFIVDSSRRRRFSDMVHPAAFRHDDLRADLHELVSRYLGTGLDVIVVEQTNPEHRAADLACVKVVIPGALPITFGHEFRRIEGLSRVLEVPRILGQRDRPLRPEEMNTDPHPFP